MLRACVGWNNKCKNVILLQYDQKRNVSFIIRRNNHQKPPSQQKLPSLLSFVRRKTATTPSTTTTPPTTTTTPTKSHKNRFIYRYPVASVSALIVFGACGYTIKYIHDNISGGTLEGLQRSISFYSFGIPKYILYRYHMYMNSPDHVWDQLHIETAALGLDKVLNLQGFYIKCGQLCASNVGNAFPQIWQDTMSILQDQCPAQDFDTIQQIIQQEYGISNIYDVFDSFDPTPIGSASIGQVHRAVLKITDPNDKSIIIRREPVVVKVCYPNVERLLRGDVRTIKAFAQIAQPVHVPGLEEIEKQFQTEFDYQMEGQHLEIVRNNLIKAGLCCCTDSSTTTSARNYNNKFGQLNKQPICCIPKPYLNFCTKRVLVMEELKGDKLIVALKKDVAKLAKLAGYSSVEEFIKHQQKAQAKIHPKHHHQQQQAPAAKMQKNQSLESSSSSSSTTTPIDATDNEDEAEEEDDADGPSAQQYERFIMLMKIKHKIEKISNTVYRWTIGLVYNPQKNQQQTNKEEDDWPLLNHAKLVDDLIYIHGHEVLVDGIFNSDPHPGNILLCRSKDGTPQLGLIDYGQVKKLTKEKRHLFARLIIALANEDKDSIVQLMKESGYKSKRMDPRNIYLYAKVYYDEDNYELTGGLHVQMFVEELQRIDPIQALPEDYIAIGRTSMVLRGLSHSLHQSRSIAKLWKPIAERVLREDI